MAKIDISKIDGYADMTPEQKIATLEAFETEDPDYSGYVKKDIFDKTASELAAKKKELNEKLTEDEQKKQKEQDGTCDFWDFAVESLLCVPTGESGGIGRRTGLRIQRISVGVQLPPLAPESLPVHS